ncbi:MAG: hypothetical protein GEV03_14230 [Streptosporangiales bacterium]|nr:hypothetical protein [Streptosporangiales bacterium]
MDNNAPPRLGGRTGRDPRQAIGAAALAAGIAVFGAVILVYVALTGAILLAGIVAGIRQARGNARTEGMRYSTETLTPQRSGEPADR